MGSRYSDEDFSVPTFFFFLSDEVFSSVPDGGLVKENWGIDRWGAAGGMTSAFLCFTRESANVLHFLTKLFLSLSRGYKNTSRK